MPIQVDSTAAQSQALAANAFQQQRQDLVRDAAKRDDEKDKTRTKPSQTASAQTQDTDVRLAKRNNESKVADNQNNQASQSGKSTQRGSVVNISV